MDFFDHAQPTCLWLRRALGDYAKTRQFPDLPADADAATLCQVVEALGLEGFLYRAESAAPHRPCGPAFSGGHRNQGSHALGKAPPEGEAKNCRCAEKKAPPQGELPAKRAEGVPRLRERALHTLLANLRALHATAALFRLLEAARIPAAAMRGVVLAHRDYASPAERAMRDVDVLCPAEARPDIVRLLVAAGHEHAATLRCQDVFRIGGVTFELHWALLTSRRYRGSIDESAWLNRRRPLDTPEGRIFILAPEDEFFGLVLHACVHHELAIFKQLLDIALFLTRDDLDWPRIAEQTRRKRLGRLFALTLGLTDALFFLDAEARRHFPLPEAMQRRLPALIRPFFGQSGIREYAARKAAMLFVAETPERRLRQLLGLLTVAEARELIRHLRRGR